jgi:hypothetical protein
MKGLLLDHVTTERQLEDIGIAKAKVRIAIDAVERGLVSAGDLPAATAADVLNLMRDVDDLLPGPEETGAIDGGDDV